ncbi:MAG: protein-export membrane protein SecF [Candidatus Yanofskybacteria bacterium RIFCSPHIGHO2_01_FULL_43_42]|uniref:Protein-export membrane protein SecF n=1 Tax=Candidatus Yanofskybacteria bacterium RIFCSPLOWO2_01_FULL_43_22 TaxID=1802695 RepID=A0A1F8GHS7_9BACT|nr:MAG: protein-export membrane protein SecF [Candidatus Yanofskybacteria bacterium RIFCSPHIGHO2_01_FULL_43_42]OGN13185.1 MAG: protein-export membrane protein SecF [Candidatus Yanofskybacteria bacterium RIFCSPHIGHO2_02_FULL_43_17]OGN24600.1 MAG: protein-export membrane protein SecF [Candidatus Yanofskybacteria bacterium RIFCSPLOWO2_01_FULL_43_22]
MKKIYTIMFFVSLAVFVVSVAALAVYGLNFGVDFKGGSIMELEFAQERPIIDDVQKVLKEKFPDIGEFNINQAGDRGLILRSEELSEKLHQEILGTIDSNFSEFGEKRFDSVGPTVGRELRNKSILAIVIVLAAIACYVAFVFRKLSRTLSLWVMNTSALVGLLHDIVIPMGVFAVLGRYYNVEISAVFVAAILTILGYTVSDKVVIFDRVRENILKGDKGDLGSIVHKSVMQTLVRSINNTLTVVLSSLAIYFFGGESIRYFALALIIGIFLGAYSSIFVASPLLVWWSKKRD